MSRIPCFYFPTTLFALDDDQNFLENIQFALSDKYKCILAGDATKARDILNKSDGWANSLLGENFSRVYAEGDPSLLSVGIDVSLLKDQVYNSNRFKNIAVAIVDYDMPKINGLEFVRSLEDSKIKVIMLTGKAKQETVIQAFNDKKIDRYISKGDSDYLQKVFQYVNELQTEFFFDFSKIILDSLKSENNVLENKSFFNIFNKIVRENNIVEYYLLDESGSFLLMDATSENQIFLILKSKEEIDHFYELAKNDRDTPTYIVERLKNHTWLTHFKKREEESMPVKTWHFVEALPLDEKREYFYAVIKNDDHFQMERLRIKSYQEFLEQS